MSILWLLLDRTQSQFVMFLNLEVKAATTLHHCSTTAGWCLQLLNICLHVCHSERDGKHREQDSSHTSRSTAINMSDTPPTEIQGQVKKDRWDADRRNGQERQVKIQGARITITCSSCWRQHGMVDAKQEVQQSLPGVSTHHGTLFSQYLDSTQNLLIERQVDQIYLVRPEWRVKKRRVQKKTVTSTTTLICMTPH